MRRHAAILGILLAAVLTFVTIFFVHRLVQAIYGVVPRPGVIWLVKPHPQKPYAY